MRKARLSVQVLAKLAVVFTPFFCVSWPSSASAESLPLEAGTYQCFTIGTSYVAPPAPDSPQEINRRAAGNNIRPMVAPGLFLGPALFGNIILDGKGGYKLPTINQSGRYGFDKAKGLPTFTGDLGAMKLAEYNGTGRGFVLRWEDTNYHCGLPAPPPAAIAPGSQQPNQDYIRVAGPIRSTATARDFNGKYLGSYACTGVDTLLRLQMEAKGDGTITAMMEFGGINTPEISYSVGSYALKGTWKGTHYVLKGDRWLKQPQGYVMVDLEGDLTTLGTSGKVLFNGCDSFAAQRL